MQHPKALLMHCIDCHIQDLDKQTFAYDPVMDLLSFGAVNWAHLSKQLFTAFTNLRKTKISQYIFEGIMESHQMAYLEKFAKNI